MFRASLVARTVNERDLALIPGLGRSPGGSERLSVSGSAAVLAAVAQGLGPGLAAVREEQAALGATFCDLAVSPTSPAWRGEEDEEAKASSGVSAPREGRGLAGLS